ncbi:hypothetical protein A2160_03745 [Candidatus Beckwithbacteria bacterium RBG_13_42_9]|uniref:Uncharacterized protein n=1 Tax=Candidatus Beckwithbacteria bacterium RBG_13_42_9 TaxID=1797457 RepID=A0A1F5E8X2_9BACT|nr:MAG: hypothetical protein A2160_03745 [Candidatus Beckwithbacteria bacterium RBG_13_42_9]
MKILIFTEGTILMHLSGQDVSREERVKQSQAEGIQREERTIAYETNSPLPLVKKGSTYDFESYIPIGDAVKKIVSWEKQGATICYLTSRRVKGEIDAVQNVLRKFSFPNSSDLYYRQQGEGYKDVAERLIPDVLIEDDCESIGGEIEMTYTYIDPKIKSKIHSVVVKEFQGIDHLPDDISKL